MMDAKGKTKDNIKARMDILLFCHHKNINLIYNGSRVAKLKASFALDNNAQLLVTNNLRVCAYENFDLYAKLG